MVLGLSSSSVAGGCGRVVVGWNGGAMRVVSSCMSVMQNGWGMAGYRWDRSTVAYARPNRWEASASPWSSASVWR